MQKAILSVLIALVLLPQTGGFAQSNSTPTPMTGRRLTYVFREEPGPSKGATYFTAEEVQTVLDSPGGDHQVGIVDVGPFNLCVGALRNRQASPNENQANNQGNNQQQPTSPYPVLPCGQTSGNWAPSGASGILHDEQSETYVILRGTATSVTGGVILNGRITTPESEQTRVLNGPSCNGVIAGDVIKRRVKAGDVVVIPPKTPHGWMDVQGTLDYILVRQDFDHALPAGYIHPSIIANHK